MATLEDINRQIQQEQDSYKRNFSRLQQEILDLKTRHQRNMEHLKSAKESIKQQNQRLESYNNILNIAIGD